MPYTQAGLPYAPRSATSRDAATKAQRFVGKQGRDVLAWLRSKGTQGGTMKECEHEQGIGRPSLCARFNGLARAGWIEKTAAKRDDCTVYVAR